MFDLHERINRIAIFLGGMRCGSTAILDYMRQHPQVCVHEKKDPHFFSSDENWGKGWNWYLSGWKRFDPEKHLVAFESSTHYTKYPAYRKSAERIAETTREIRLIYGVRDPVARVESHLIHNIGKGYLTIDDVDKRRKLIEQAVNVSNYEMQVAQYERFFVREHIFILPLPRLKSSPVECMREVFNYVGVDQQQTEIHEISLRSRRFKNSVSGVVLTDHEKAWITSELEYPTKRFEKEYNVEVWRTE